MIKIITALSLLTIVGCHSTHNKDNSEVVAQTSNKEQVCEQSATTGSNLKKRRCMSRKLADQIQRVNQENMKTLNRAQKLGDPNKK